MAKKEGSKIRVLVIAQIIQQRGRATTKEIQNSLSNRLDMDVDWEE